MKKREKQLDSLKQKAKMTSNNLQPPKCKFLYLYDDHLLSPCACCTQLQRWWEEETRQLHAKLRTKDNIMSEMEDKIFEMEAKAEEIEAAEDHGGTSFKN